MYRVEDQIKKLASVTSVMLLAALEAWAQEMQGQTAPARRIVVSIPDKKLALIESGKVVKIFPTAVGAEKTPSPTGSFKIVARIADPTWYHPGKVVPAGKNNPLGPRWIGLSLKGYGIHGTNSPRSIGHNASHGCIRMRNQDVETLFDLVSVGDSVELLGERTPETDGIFGPAPAAVTAATAAPKTAAPTPKPAATPAAPNVQ